MDVRDLLNPLVNEYHDEGGLATPPSSPKLGLSRRDYDASRCLERSPSNSESGAQDRTPSRPEYDREELLFIMAIGLRIDRAERRAERLTWKDVLDKFHVAFPPGLRRTHQDSTNARLLPELYVPRTVAGLQSEYYRIRSNLALPRQRDRDPVQDNLVIMRELKKAYFQEGVPLEFFMNKMGLRPGWQSRPDEQGPWG